MLEKLLDDPSTGVRTGVAKALGTWGTSAQVESLIPAIDDQSHFVRRAAYRALAQLKDPRAIKPIAKRFADPKSRADAAHALTAFGADGEPAVQAYLSDSDPQTRAEACRLFGRMGSDASVDRLNRATHDARREVATAAKYALRDLMNRSGRPAREP
ncbi:HEAT repeat domain-containing protein [Singulisphaera sp. PoT]|uniref:HEAT repeat domain-containing protein n=1 Tax=Singulisphaera sp. PoT TaxID=3411797 RepID=UPI003BF49595